MRKLLIVVLTLCFVGNVFADDTSMVDGMYDLFTGDTKTACEVLLCLSSKVFPTECKEPLKKYFGIRKFDWKGSFDYRKTINARKDFLKLCPKGEGSNAGQFNSYVNVTAESAGNCDVDALNSRGQWIISSRSVAPQGGYSKYGRKSVCDGWSNSSSAWHTLTYTEVHHGGGKDGSEDSWSECVENLRYWQVDRSEPWYCTEMWHHDYTTGYEGEELPRLFITTNGNRPWETRWIDK